MSIQRTMFPCLHLGWFVLLVLIPNARGYGTGAPTSACVHMKPGHTGFEAQTSASPYTLVVTRSEDSNDTMKVCVKGTSFKGILGQVRVDGMTKPLGTFDDANLPSDTKLVKCTADKDSVTHNNTIDKADGTCFIWNIHDKKNTHKLRFVATIAESKEKYWVQVKSNIFTVFEDTNAMEHDTTTAANGATSTGLTFTATALGSLLAVVAGIAH